MMMTVTSVSDLGSTAPVGNETVTVLGYYTAGDGGGGIFYWDGTGTANGGTVFAAPVSSGGVWKRLYSGALSARWFGAKGDGTTDDFTAINTAQNISEVFLPGGSYLMKSPLTLMNNIIGEGIGKSTLLFSGLSAAQSAITARDAAYNRLSLQNLSVEAYSWDPVTGALGYGVEATRTLYMKNVYVGKFKKSNLFLHHVVAGPNAYNGPYYSLIENCYFHHSGEHGVCVGTGANSFQLVNVVAAFNGAPSFNVSPSAPGNFDGLFISRTGDGNPGDAYPSFTPEGVRVVGGDFSYNSRYGVNVDEVMNSNIQTDYSEGNFNTNQVRVGEFTRTSMINFAMGSSADLNVTDVDSFTTVNPNQINIGAVCYGTGNKDTNGVFTSQTARRTRNYLSLGTDCKISTSYNTLGDLYFKGEGWMPKIVLEDINLFDTPGTLSAGTLKLGGGHTPIPLTDAPTVKIPIMIGETTYYLLATT